LDVEREWYFLPRLETTGHPPSTSTFSPSIPSLVPVPITYRWIHFRFGIVISGTEDLGYSTRLGEWRPFLIYLNPIFSFHFE
jgi:hypothetical protein